MPFVIFRGGSFAVHIGDHLRFGIICGPFWGSFPVWGSFAVGDHLRRCTEALFLMFADGRKEPFFLFAETLF